MKEIKTYEWVSTLGDKEVIKHIVAGSALDTVVSGRRLHKHLYSATKEGLISVNDLIRLLEDLYIDDDWENDIRILCIENGYVRKEWAERGDEIARILMYRGYYLTELAHNKCEIVRMALAMAGHCLDILVYDKDPEVRLEVACHGYGLNILVDDPSADVRIMVARHGYGLEWLVCDPDPSVRYAVAEYGYGLDILINDENEWVRDMARIRVSQVK